MTSFSCFYCTHKQNLFCDFNKIDSFIWSCKNGKLQYALATRVLNCSFNLAAPLTL